MPGFDFPSGYTAFQFVFVLLQSAAFGGVFTGFGIARDFESGFARRLLLAAPHRTGIVLGYAVAALVRWIVTAAILTVVALAVGMHVGGSGVDLFGLYLLGLLVNIAAVLWAAGVAMRLRTMQAGPDHADAGLPRPLLRARLRAARPARRAGSTRSRVVNPLTRVLEAGRSLIAGSPTRGRPGVRRRGSRSSGCSPSGRCAGCGRPRRPADGVAPRP